MWMGWFIRGLHHFGAQAVMVLLALHLLQVLIAGAYRKPREVNWWFGMALLVLTVGFSHTGYQLPWDQKGYWATKVVTNIIGGCPGDRAVRSRRSSSAAPTTATRRSRGSTACTWRSCPCSCSSAWRCTCSCSAGTASRRRPAPTAAAEHYWPAQTFKDMVFSRLVFGVMLALVSASAGPTSTPRPTPRAPTTRRGPSGTSCSSSRCSSTSPATSNGRLDRRPRRRSWLVLFLLPLLDRLLARAGSSTSWPVRSCSAWSGGGLPDARGAAGRRPDTQFHRGPQEGRRGPQRALELAASPEDGVPPEGPASPAAADPLTHGQAVLEKKCLGCHVLRGQGHRRADGAPT